MSQNRGEASQFFNEGEESSQGTTEKVIQLLNKIQSSSTDDKVSYLKQIQELIVNKDPTLLDNFLDEILIYQQDRSSDVRKFVVIFIEEACKKDPELLPKTIGCLSYMLTDENTTVMKRVMLACNSLYKIALQLVCKIRTIKQHIKDMWESMTELKRQICGLIESDNDGVRTHAIKFMDMMILVHSKQPENSDQPKKDSDVSIDIVPSNHPLVKYDDLVAEGMTTMEALLALCGSSNISSVNLMAVLSSLTNIGKQRPPFLSTVVQAFELLHANLPPTLSKSQVSSVRKNIKMQLFALIKLPAADPFVTQIGTLLTDLGATSSEIQKSLPKVSETRKRRAEEEARQSKKSKKDEKGDSNTGQFSLSKAIELTTADIVPRLTKEAVTDLVLVSMLFLPRSMPSHFQETFTPIAAAGSSLQSEHLGRLMATQMTNAGIGVGIEKAKEIAEAELKAQKEAKKEAEKKEKPQSKASASNTTSSEKQNINIKPRSIRDIAAELKTGSKLVQETSTGRTRKIKPFKLQDAAKRMSSKEVKEILHSTYRRILSSDKQAAASGATVERYKIIVGLAMQFYGDLTQVLIDFVMEDFRSRIDLGILWLYQEYVKTESGQPGGSMNDNSQYALCLRSLIAGISSSLEPRDKLFTRFILEAPSLPDSIRNVIKDYCMDPERIMVGFATLRELINKSPAKSSRWLQLLLELTTAQKEQVRVQAIHSAKKLHSHPDFTELIEDFAAHSLQQLTLETPPIQNHDDLEEWSEESIKAYLYLYLALLPSNHTLFLNLADIYVDSSPVIKRTILRHLEHPVRTIGMHSSELLHLVEKCPAGAETLVTRVLHIVTDKNPPTDELVQKVKDLYHQRVSDVRFLIPVLCGLQKQEIIDALPKLIAQSPNVVKEVFNRLLGSFQAETTEQASPLSPAELLVALHTIEAKSDVKAIMKAINICFGEKEIYTQEVLAVVIQQLIDITPLPTLFMRTVIQSLGMCPRLVGFVMNILSKLISKQVWKYSKVWQGFVKCCQMTKPQSFPILLQLPPKQLESVFKISPELKPLLLTHIESMTANQRSHIPKTLLQILESESSEGGASSSSGNYSSATFSSSQQQQPTTSATTTTSDSRDKDDMVNS